MRLRKTIGLSLALLFASGTAMAKDAEAARHPVHSIKAKPTRQAAAAGPGSKRHRVQLRAETRRSRLAMRRHAAALPPPDEYLGPVNVIGAREVGSAAWYGGRHIGRRTASGARLDAIHLTAAHRWLPLRSLVRVTNLTNGRSVIAEINDRGPVSHSLLIDLSPRAAEELHMIHAGIAKVSIEPVAPVHDSPR